MTKNLILFNVLIIIGINTLYASTNEIAWKIITKEEKYPLQFLAAGNDDQLNLLRNGLQNNWYKKGKRLTLNSTTSSGETLLSIALKRSDNKVLNILLDATNTQDEEWKSFWLPITFDIATIIQRTPPLEKGYLISRLFPIISELYNENEPTLPQEISYYGLVRSDNIVFVWAENEKKQLLGYGYASKDPEIPDTYNFDYLHTLAKGLRELKIGKNLKVQLSMLVHNQGGKYLKGTPSSFDLKKGEQQKSRQKQLENFYKKGVNATKISDSELLVDLNSLMGENPETPTDIPGGQKRLLKNKKISPLPIKEQIRPRL